MRVKGNYSNHCHRSSYRTQKGRQMRKSDLKANKIKHRIVKQERTGYRKKQPEIQVVEPVYPEIMLQVAVLLLRQNL